MTVLTPDLLERLRSRAPGYDRDNTFFSEDLDELRSAGYLAPQSLLESARNQRLLARFAPATALAINMHHVVVGVARVVSERGDASLDWILDDARAGELFAFGNSEAGNDEVMFDSGTRAEPQPDGSYLFSGTKIFTSLSPAWTRLGIFGRDDSDPDAPVLVHGYLHRDSGGHRAVGEWNTLGMRATQSFTTVLENAPVAADRIARVLPVGPSADPYIFGIFSNFLLLISSVYAGIADRALELGVEAAHRRTSKKSGKSYADDPDIRWQLADAAIALDALAPQIESLAADVDRLIDHGGAWFRLLVGTKTRAIDTARDVVEKAIRCSGGASYSADSELSRLYRDALAGLFHPSDPESAHATVANSLLGPVSPPE
ncbi:alkylation response protein AidB-like acyl-CoA dehydrogenase [Okibacterium sp. HSC-33S16]|uniref:acyl-CoA dehydrogenase family protein n=1 Tax=Okibacterium sp. HSC-33S16 TaxID=2910965 RepID=UPI00209ED71E|nr:acyl-CoA dehydrogenase family protein [Okibacterium sp. HSC-33S16]MCP2032720.1 alkylation response protein AidB-like acyl-CoA dehydrogenase [Okibacterium sp. HSC-33S16]